MTRPVSKPQLKRRKTRILRSNQSSQSCCAGGILNSERPRAAAPQPPQATSSKSRLHSSSANFGLTAKFEFFFVWAEVWRRVASRQPLASKCIPGVPSRCLAARRETTATSPTRLRSDFRGVKCLPRRHPGSCVRHPGRCAGARKSPHRKNGGGHLRVACARLSRRQGVVSACETTTHRYSQFHTAGRC